MIKLCRRVIIVSFAFLLVIENAIATERRYIVRNGDTLSRIALTYAPSLPSLYGPSGRIQYLLDLNPQIKDPDLIFVGQTIYVHPESNLIQSSTPPPTPLQAEATGSAKESRQIKRSLSSENSPESEGVVATTNEKYESLPVPETTTRPDVKPQDVTQKDSRLEVDFQAGLIYFRIDGTDRLTNGKSTFLSSPLPQIGISIKQKLSLSTYLVSQIQYTALDFEPLGNGKTLTHPRGLAMLALGASHRFNENNFYLGASVRSRGFIRSESVDRFRMDAVPISALDFHFSRTLIELNKTYFYGGLGASYLLSSRYLDYSIESGSALGMRLGAKTDFSEYSFDQSLAYEIQSQSSAITQHTTQEITLRLNLSRRF